MKGSLCLFLVFLLVFLNVADGKLNQEELNKINQFRKSKDAIFNAGQPKIHHSKLNSDGPFCQKLVAYYEGNFVNQQNSKLNYTAQFQVRLNANTSDKRIYVIFDQWNNTLQANNPFSFDFTYGSLIIPGNQIGASYWGPFSSEPNNHFTLTLDHAKNPNWDNSINILYFNVFNNSFQLENSIGQCTANQLESPSNIWNMNSSLVKYCVCCGDYLPDSFLGCPTNPWHQQQQLTTKKALKTTVYTSILSTSTALPSTVNVPISTLSTFTPSTSTPSTSSTPVPTPQNISCQKISGYFVGKFQDPNDRTNTLNAQFQFTLDANLNDKNIYFNLQHWNQSYSDSKDALFYIEDGYDYNSNYVNDGNLELSILFAPYDSFFTLVIGKNPSGSGFQIFDYDWYTFTNRFPLANTINGCTNSQPLYNVDAASYLPDPSLYSYCICCGDYLPDPFLGCPTNPWHQQQQSTTKKTPTTTMLAFPTFITETTTSIISVRTTGSNCEETPSTTVSTSTVLPSTVDVPISTVPTSTLSTSTASTSTLSTHSVPTSTALPSTVNVPISTVPTSTVLPSTVNVPISTVPTSSLSTSTVLPSTSTASTSTASTSTVLPSTSTVNVPISTLSTFTPSTSTPSTSTALPSTVNVPTSTVLPSTVNVPISTVYTSSLSTSSTPVPIPQNISCQKISGYFVGTFKDPNDRTYNSLNAQFQFTLDANSNDERIYFNLQHWNQPYTDGKIVYFWISDAYDSNRGWVYDGNLSFSIPFAPYDSYFVLEISEEESNVWFSIFDYDWDTFTNSFPLTNTINGCTNNQPLYNFYPREYLPDPNLYSYCLCCGDYKPDSSLNCPANPWI